MIESGFTKINEHIFLKYSSPWDLCTNKILTTVLDGIFKYPHIVALKKTLSQGAAYYNFLSIIMVLLKNVVKLSSQKNIGTIPLGPALKRRVQLKKINSSCLWI